MEESIQQVKSVPLVEVKKEGRHKGIAMRRQNIDKSNKQGAAGRKFPKVSSKSADSQACQL